MLRLFTPANAHPERLYIADVLLKQFLGLQVAIQQHNRREVFITDGADRRLILDDSFFGDLGESLLRADKVPSMPMAKWRPTESSLDAIPGGQDLPVLFGKPLANGRFAALSEKEIHLGLDVLGSSFFMLSRYEELISPQRDQYDRFPASASVAHKGGFLARPIVNEYLEVLWQCLERLWPGLKRREHRFRVILSHDVDQPFLLRKDTFPRVVRTMAGDVIKRTSPLRALRRPAQWVKARAFGPEYDPAYTFGYIMDFAEKHGLRSAFYFIPSLSAGPPDYRYGLHDPDIQRLMSAIHARGHELGYHASIATYLDKDLIQKEVELLRVACEKVGARQGLQGSRQHYLRIQPPATLRYLADAGLAYDTTLSYADHAGFRCGTCWEYPFYDLQHRISLRIIERPLILMECSVIDPQYMGLGTGQKALDFMVQLAQTCRRFSGDFTLLWHNSRLVSQDERRLFEELLERISN